MTEDRILSSLEEVLTKLSIGLRYEKGDFVGGLYRYHDSERVVINKDLSPRQKITVLATELREKIDFDNFYLVPALREVIENASRQGQQ